MKITIAATLVASAVLSFTGVSSAAAQSPPQVTGARIQAALLSPSAFGEGFMFKASLNTGAKLSSTRATLHFSSISCSRFEANVYVSYFGDTAGALASYANPHPYLNYPETIFDGFQDVMQFATKADATTYFDQAEAKYATCQSFAEPNPGDNRPGGGTALVTTLSQSATTVNGDRAFTLTQMVAPSEASGVSFYHENTLYVVAGTNVYSLLDLSGTDDEPSPALMSDLIGRVQALYPR
jgi:hypothetical protein